MRPTPGKPELDVAEASDAEVIASSLEDPEAFAVIFDRYADPIHGYLSRRVGEMADDLLSETFLIALRSRDRFRPEATTARPWLFGIAANLVARHYRAEQQRYRHLARLPLEASGSPDPATLASARADATALAPLLATALAELEPGDRDVLTLIAFGDLQYSEVAEALQIPLGTVRSRLHRARARLRTFLPANAITDL